MSQNGQKLVWQNDCKTLVDKFILVLRYVEVCKQWSPLYDLFQYFAITIMLYIRTVQSRKT